MSDAILVLNAGSSSIKFSVFLAPDEAREEALELRLAGHLEEIHTAPRFRARDAAGAVLHERQWTPAELGGHEGGLEWLLEFLQAQPGGHALVAVGHRVVHGGLDHSAPVRLSPGLLARLERFVPLAPSHQPHNLEPIRVLFTRHPELPQVACFDTAFHRTQPELAQAFALPPEITREGVRRYGFHGLSYEYIASVLAGYDPRAARGRTVVLHLGNGASMCALQDGRSIATTMGFTAVDGLPMGTRCGNIDPGVVLYLMDAHGMDARAVEELLYQRSGLLGVSGISSDMRVLLASPEPRARFAVDLFAYRIGRELGSLAATLGGLDALVFTAGIGEHAAPVRAQVCEAAAWLGVELDPVANAIHGPRISTATSRASAWVIPTDEELMIARHTLRVLREAPQA
jgi:acetate kinase